MILLHGVRWISTSDRTADSSEKKNRSHFRIQPLCSNAHSVHSDQVDLKENKFVRLGASYISSAVKSPVIQSSMMDSRTPQSISESTRYFYLRSSPIHSLLNEAPNVSSTFKLFSFRSVMHPSDCLRCPWSNTSDSLQCLRTGSFVRCWNSSNGGSPGGSPLSRRNQGTNLSVSILARWCVECSDGRPTGWLTRIPMQIEKWTWLIILSDVFLSVT